MLNVTYFSSQDIADGKANDYIKTAAAIPEKGIYFNQNGMFITSDDGSGFGKNEAVQVLIGDIKKLKLQLLTIEPDIRVYTAKKLELKQESESRELKPFEMDQMTNADTQLTLSNAEKDRIIALIASNEGLLKDIIEDNFKI